MKLCVFDLDGTLLDEDKCITLETIELIKELKKTYDVTIASGRSYMMVDEYVKLLVIHLPLILCNGSIIRGNGFYKSYPLDGKILMILLPLLDAYESHLHVYTEDKVYTKVINGNVMDLHGDLKEWDSHLDVCVVDKYSFINESVFKILIPISDQNDLLPYIQAISGLHVFRSGGAYEVVSSYADKGLALKTLCQALNFEPDQVVVFGDSENDLGMFEYAGTGIAMANACDRLKDLADYISLSNRNEGVAHGIKKWLMR